VTDLDKVLHNLDELNRVPGRDVEVVSIDRCRLLEEGFRLLVAKIAGMEDELINQKEM
jgi:hypothetical protein